MLLLVCFSLQMVIIGYHQRVLQMATFELYRRSTTRTCLTDTLDEMMSIGILGPDLAVQLLVQFDKVTFEPFL